MNATQSTARRLMAALAAVVAGLIASTAHAEIHTEPIEYKQGDQTFEGFLAYDGAKEGRRPGVLVAHEWMGLGPYAERRARQLAELGYIAFAVDMYGKGVRPKDAVEAGSMAGALKDNRRMMRERAAAGLEVLRQYPLTDPAHIAAIGYCLGGTTVLELARSGADLRGIVSFHGGLATPTPQDAKHIHGKVLALHGADDPFVKPEEVADFEQEMREGGVNWQLVKYGGAVHSFTNPDSGRDASKGAAYNEQADRRSWAEMRQFLDEVFSTQ